MGAALHDILEHEGDAFALTSYDFAPYNRTYERPIIEELYSRVQHVRKHPREIKQKLTDGVVSERCNVVYTNCIDKKLVGRLTPNKHIPITFLEVQAHGDLTRKYFGDSYVIHRIFNDGNLAERIINHTRYTGEKWYNPKTPELTTILDVR